MKDKWLIYEGDPCSMCLDDPDLQSRRDVEQRGPQLCRYYSDRAQCSPPRYNCVRLAGQKVARYALLFYAEASDRTLALELQEFRQRAALPPGHVEAYIDTPEHGCCRITDPEVIVERVGEYARAILDLRGGQRVFRDPEEPQPLRREVEAGLPLSHARATV